MAREPYAHLNANLLRVAGIDRVVLGDSRMAGRPCARVRLAGCVVGCAWCDLPERSVAVGRDLHWEHVLEAVRPLAGGLVEIGGAEPLAWPATARLAYALAKEGCRVQVATSGTRDISVLPHPVVRLMDLKGPSSGAATLTYWYNLGCLHHDDEVRFPVADRRDYEYARDILEKHRLAGLCRVVFRPVGLHPARLAEWLLFDTPDAALELDWHRFTRLESVPKSVPDTPGRGA